MSHFPNNKCNNREFRMGNIHDVIAVTRGESCYDCYMDFFNNNSKRCLDYNCDCKFYCDDSEINYCPFHNK